MERTHTVLKTATASVITAIARQTTVCEIHGQIEAVRPYEGSVIERGSYMRVMLYDVTFANGIKKTFWMRGGIPVRIQR